MEDGLVQDTSGRGNDGMFYGNKYSAPDKAFSFSGATSDYIDQTLPREFVGDPTLTISMWVNPITLATASGQYDTFIHLGHNNSNGQIQLTYYGYDGHLQIGGYGQGMKTNDASAVPIGRWTHICAVLTPGAWSTTTKKLYINGEFFPTTLSNSGTTSIPAGSASSRLVFGAVINNTGTGYGHPSNIKMSNPKLYDTALTAEEVKTLYDMGQCDEGHHVVNFSKTRVGIGLGDGEAPQAALDVRGDVKVDGSFQCGTGTLRFHTLHGVHPATGNQTVPFAFRGSVYGTASNIISVSGVSQNTNGDLVPWDYHAESSAWEVQAYYDVGNQYFVIFSQGTSTRGNKWSMYIVTT